MSELPKGWDRKPVSELCELIVDCVNKTAPLAKEPTPYKMIRTPNIKKGKVSLDGCRYVEKEVFEKWTRRANILRSDVLLTREAPLGEVGMVNTDENVFLGQRVMQYRADKSKLYPHFLLYSFLSRDLQYQFRMHEGSGSVVSYIRVGDCLKFELSLPPLPEQKAIADMLSSFDEKIELLREQNKTLETLAQTIFKEWFVNFNYPDATGDMVDSELGEIPKGWRVDGIRCLVEHIKKNIKPFKFPDKEYQHFSIPAFDSGKRPEGHKGNEISSNKYSVVENCFLVSKLNPSTPRVWAVFLPHENSICSTEFQVIKPKESGVFGFVYGALTSYGLRRELSARAHGTSSSHQRVNPADILDTPIALPCDGLIKSYSIMANELLGKIDNNSLQITALSKTRDILLPKLMNGSIRVHAFTREEANDLRIVP